MEINSIPKKIWRRVIMSPSASLRDAILNLDKSGLQIVLVLSEDGTLIGTLTDGDVRRALIKGLDLSARLEQCMERKPITASKKVDHEDARKILEQKKINYLPIIDHRGKIKSLYSLNIQKDLANKQHSLVIMAGGKGQRMMPLSENCPKPMLEVNGKPMLQHIIENARDSGITDIYISINHLGEIIEDYFQGGEHFDVSINYLKEKSPLGTAGSLAVLAGEIRRPFLVSNGDVLSNVEFRRILEYHKFNKAAATMAVRLHEMPNPFGVVELSGVEISNFVEKPVYRSYVNAGVYVLEPFALDVLVENEYCDMPQLFQRISDSGDRIIAFPMYERWSDVGTPKDLEMMRSEFYSSTEN